VKWKLETGGRKGPAPDHIELANRAWKKAGQPAEGIVFQGRHYFFEPDGTFNLMKNFEANFFSAKSG